MRYAASTARRKFISLVVLTVHNVGTTLLTKVLSSSIFWSAFIFTISPSGVERRVRLHRRVKHWHRTCNEREMLPTSLSLLKFLKSRARRMFCLQDSNVHWMKNNTLRWQTNSHETPWANGILSTPKNVENGKIGPSLHAPPLPFACSPRATLAPGLFPQKFF